MFHVEDLSSGYGRSAVLHEIALEVRPGEIVALIGANGAGKSTLLNTIMGLVTKRSGRLTFEDADISALSTTQIVRRGIALVPERRELFASLSVKENLLLGAHTRPARDWRGSDEVGLDLKRQLATFPRIAERMDQRAGSLSGGEQQMLAIARAMMSRPRLLLLDEPSLGLAPTIVANFFATIVELQKSGNAILLVEQNARAALAICSRVYVVEVGRIVFAGSPEAVIADETIRDAYLGGVTGEMESRIRRRAARPTQQRRTDGTRDV
jgi:branched-chain amino acid transport system ATP-binding protein